MSQAPVLIRIKNTESVFTLLYIKTICQKLRKEYFRIEHTTILSENTRFLSD